MLLLLDCLLNSDLILEMQRSRFRFLESTMPNKKVYRKKEASKPHVCNYEARNRRFLLLPTQYSSGCYRVTQTMLALELKCESSRNVFKLFVKIIYQYIRSSGSIWTEVCLREAEQLFLMAVSSQNTNIRHFRR